MFSKTSTPFRLRPEGSVTSDVRLARQRNEPGEVCCRMLPVMMYGAVLLMSVSKSVQITVDIWQLFRIFRSGSYCNQVLTNLFETFKNLQDASKIIHLKRRAPTSIRMSRKTPLLGTHLIVSTTSRSFRDKLVFDKNIPTWRCPVDMELMNDSKEVVVLCWYKRKNWQKHAEAHNELLCLVSCWSPFMLIPIHNNMPFNRHQQCGHQLGISMVVSVSAPSHFAN